MPNYYNAGTGTVTVPGNLVVSGTLTSGNLTMNGDITMQSGYQIFLDTATSVANPPLAFRGDENNGIAYVSADSWRTVCGGANGYTYTFGAGSQNGAISSGGGLSVGTVLSLTGDISPSALTGDVTDWAPTGIGTAPIVRVDPGAAGRIINSMTAGTDGAFKLLINVSTTQTVTLNHDDGTGTAAQRFLCPNGVDFALAPTAAVLCVYDSTSARWRVIGPVA